MQTKMIGVRFHLSLVRSLFSFFFFVLLGAFESAPAVPVVGLGFGNSTGRNSLPSPRAGMQVILCDKAFFLSQPFSSRGIMGRSTRRSYFGTHTWRLGRVTCPVATSIFPASPTLSLINSQY